MIRRMVSREGWYADVPADEWMEDPEFVTEEDFDETGYMTLVMRAGVVLCCDGESVLVSYGGLLARVPKDANPERIVWRRRSAA
jgi:hypothetical protein